jgi:predicted RNase H-like HicB family nuclease
MQYLAVIEAGPTSYGAYAPDLPGCIAVGSTRAEVSALIHEAIEFHIEGMKDEGVPIPTPSSSSELVEVEA